MRMEVLLVNERSSCETPGAQTPHQMNMVSPQPDKERRTFLVTIALNITRDQSSYHSPVHCHVKRADVTNWITAATSLEASIMGGLRPTPISPGRATAPAEP